MTKKSHLDVVIGERVDALLNKRHLYAEPFARSIGLDGGQFRRLLKGNGRWNTWHLEIVASGLDIPVTELLADQPTPDPTNVDPKTNKLLAWTQEVLTSGDDMHASALESNIVSFWHAVQGKREAVREKQEMARMAERVALLEEKLKECPTCATPEPESSDGEAI
jgi:hypothetical protein